MARFATLAESFGVGSLHVGLRDVRPEDRRAFFQFVSNSPFFADVYATLDFDFVTNTGSNWFKVTDRFFLDRDKDDNQFDIIGGFFQWRRPSQGVSLDKPGVYAFDESFMPAAFNVNVTSVTSGDPLKIVFGV